MTHSTLEQAMQSNNPVIIAEKEYTYLGNDRKMLKVRRAKGKKVFLVIQYENGQFSNPT